MTWEIIFHEKFAEWFFGEEPEWYDVNIPIAGQRFAEYLAETNGGESL